MSKILFISGHGKSDKGGYDSGAVSRDGKYHEFKIAREIAKYAQAYYNANFEERADLMNYNGEYSLQERINRLKDDTYSFIAEIHLNAGGGTGTECYYYHGSERGRAYADAICKAIAADLGVKQRSNGSDDGGDKIKLSANGSDYFGIIRSTKPCAVLVETVFIDTQADLDKVKTAAGQKKCGEAIARAVAQVRGAKKKTASTPAAAQPTNKYFTPNATMLATSKVYADNTRKLEVGSVSKGEAVKVYASGSTNSIIQYNTANGYKVGIVYTKDIKK